MYAEAIANTRSLVHLMSSTYTKLQMVELTCDYIYNGIQWMLIDVQDFRIKGTHKKSWKKKNKKKQQQQQQQHNKNQIRKTKPTRRSPVKRAQTASSIHVGTTLPSLLANANGQQIPLGTSRRRRPATTGGVRGKKIKCSGKYCVKVQKNTENLNKDMCSLLYKSIIEDNNAGSDHILPRDRAKMYSTVQVCEDCYVQYIEKDKEREKTKKIANER